MTEPAIQVRDLWQVFGPKPARALDEARASSADDLETAEKLKAQDYIPAVRAASFDVAPGELFVVMGLSGSGKSTLIRGISRLVEPTAGAVKIMGEDILSMSKRRLIEMRRRHMGMVFQHFGLFPHMTVLDNVSYPLRVQGVGREARAEKAREVIELVGLKGREDAWPRELSGGQRQRVGIARSLAGDCDVWMLDEPFSALDPLIRRQLQDEFLDIRARLNTTIVFITHDIFEALKIADRIAIMRDGVVVQIGTPAEIILNPADDYVRAFTDDVPKGRHTKVGSVMKAERGAVASDIELRTGMTLEQAMAACAGSLGEVAVKDGEGRVVGSVRPGDLIRALGHEAAH